MDEELGAEVLRAARADGLTLAMPVEKSGQKLFALQYGADTGAHIAEFDPDYVKVLVRMNPDDDPAGTRAQLTALAELSQQLHASGRAFLYELLVPATDAAARRPGIRRTRYDARAAARAVARVIDVHQQAEAWSRDLEDRGPGGRGGRRAMAAAARRGGREPRCIVLGRDAPAESSTIGSRSPLRSPGTSVSPWAVPSGRTACATTSAITTNSGWWPR